MPYDALLMCGASYEWFDGSYSCWKQVFRYVGIRFNSIRLDECFIIFICNITEQQGGLGVYSLLEFGCTMQPAVYLLNHCFAHNTDLTFGRVDESARWFGSKIFLVVFECDEGLLLGVDSTRSAKLSSYDYTANVDLDV